MSIPVPEVNYSVYNAPGDGSTTEWNFNFAGAEGGPGYISQDHIKAITTNPLGVVAPVVFTWVGPTTISIVPAVPVGTELTIYRDTPRDKPLVNFSTTAIMNEANLDKMAQQAVYVAAEMIDRFTESSTNSDAALAAAQAAVNTAVAAEATANAAEATANGIAATANSAVVTANSAVTTADSAVTTANAVSSALAVYQALLASASGGANVSTQQAGSGTVPRTVEEELRDWIKVSQLGGLPSASAAANSAAFAATVAVANTVGKGVLIPAGSYTLDARWLIPYTGMRIVPLGKVILNFTNTGNCIEVDGGASSTSIYDVHFGTSDNPIWINGNANTATALFWRASHHGSAAIKAWNCVTGHHTQFAVCNAFYITVSSAERVSNTLTPTTGILCDRRSSGEDTAANTWYLPVIEGIKTGTGRGVDLLHTNRNKFKDGTSEGNIIGVFASATSLGDTIDGMYCEVNTGAAHFDISGQLITILDCESTTSAPTPTNWVRVRTGATDCRILGGNHPSIQVDSGAVRTLIIGNAHAGTNTVVDNGTDTTVIQGPAAAKLPFGVHLGGGVAPLGLYDDLTWTPVISGSTTAGTPTYTVQNGSYQKVGKWTHFRLYVSVSSLGGAAGNLQISLPVAASGSANTHSTSAIGRFTGVTFDTNYSTLGAVIPPGGTVLTIYESGNNVASQPIQCTKFAATTLLMIEGKYMTP